MRQSAEIAPARNTRDPDRSVRFGHQIERCRAGLRYGIEPGKTHRTKDGEQMQPLIGRAAQGGIGWLRLVKWFADQRINERQRCTMVRLDGETSNSLFEVLQDWNDQLSHVKFDREEPHP
jgi:hypothetical protein